MRRHAARGNRIGLTLLGLALLLAGAALLAQSHGLFGRHNSTQAIYPPAAQRYVHSHSWIWAAVAAAAIIIGLLCLRWLLVQTRRDRLRRARLDHDRTRERGAGRTVLLSAALSDVIDDDLTAVPGVRSAAGQLAGSPDHPDLWLSITTDADADLAALRQHLTSELLPSLRGALNQPDLAGYLSLTVTHRRPGHGAGSQIRVDTPSDVPAERTA